ncbi:MAG: hypothetical protein Q4G27_08900 [Flavobacteriaceae bacterium]|nr:hypothetical protein [Flavobacteriaceae bacterium]
MSKITYTNSLMNEYIQLYKSMEIKLDKLSVIENHVDKITQSKARYLAIEKATGVPWFFVALVHTMESGRNFNTHLHNGDPLTKRTRQVPKGRPATGQPPFTWEESAIDALRFKNLHKESDWSLPKTLYQLENYNGWGYRLYHKHVFSPYLWSYSHHYRSGKYVADGTWSNTAVSGQAGAAVILRRLEQRNIIPAFQIDELKEPFFRHNDKFVERAEDLQRFLNTFPGISLLVDGKPGNKTSEACFKIFGNYLKGDSRA